MSDALSESVVISPAAVHAGIIRNLDSSRAVLESYGWNNLRGLREAAIKDGMEAVYNGIQVSRLCDDMLGTAAAGLDSSEHWMLAYPEYVCQTRQNGAERALDRYDALPGRPAERIRQIVRERAFSTA